MATRAQTKTTSPPLKSALKNSNRNVPRGIWELGRLHTKESFLCWYPAIWGACLSASLNHTTLSLLEFSKILASIWLTVTMTHATFCTFNDIVDRNLDIHVARCKVRPLPSGMLTLPEALLALLAWLAATAAVTYTTMGQAGALTFAPIWVGSFVYPFMKRLIPFPQVILGAVIGAAVFPGWVAANDGSTAGLDQAVPVFLATAVWVVYFDVFYATQDTRDDKEAGVKSLAILFEDELPLFLGSLGVLQVVFFAVTALRANMSPVFWVLGVGVWTGNVIWHVASLDRKDPRSGGRIFKWNIMLGLWMTAVAIVELWLTTVVGWEHEKHFYGLVKGASVGGPAVMGRGFEWI